MEKTHKIEDLRDYLFAQLERLANPAANLEKECQRAEALVHVANSIIDTARAEIEFIKATTGDDKAATGFFPIAKEERKYFIEK